MPSTSENLSALKKTIERLLSVSQHQGPETVTMTPAEFMEYAVGQIAKANEEDAAAAGDRLTHLFATIEAIEKSNAFDSAGASFSVYNGPEAQQRQTAAREESMKEQSPAAAAAMGTMDRNFAQKAADHVRGMFKDPALVAEFDALLERASAVSTEKADDAKTEEVEKSEGESSEVKADEKADEKKEEAKKAEPFMWPRDMNEPDLPEGLDFGRDPKKD